MSVFSKPRAPGSGEAAPRSRTWRALLRWLGLSPETRVHIVAPGLDIVLRGEPRRVRRLLKVVTAALEAEPDSRPSPLPGPKGAAEAGRRKHGSKAPSSEVVLPSELDEMDSPYALPASDSVEPSAREVVPAPEVTYEIPGRQADRLRRELQETRVFEPSVEDLDRPGMPLRTPVPRAPSLSLPTGFEPPTVLTPGSEDASNERTPVSGTVIDPERTAVELHAKTEVYDVRTADVEVSDGQAASRKGRASAQGGTPRRSASPRGRSS